MGSSQDKYYEENKVNVYLCKDTSDNTLANNLANSIFEKNDLEYKQKFEIKDHTEYIYFKGNGIFPINENNIDNVINNIDYDVKAKNIIVCILSSNKKIDELKKKFNRIVKENTPFIIFVLTYEFSQNLNEVKKLFQINTIKYFGNSREDINETNTVKTTTIIKNKLLQIDGYLNERGTLFRDYLFGLLNNVNGEVNEQTNINDLISGNRSTLNIFLFGNPRVGKSRFINLSMNELISRERFSTVHTTKKFIEYELPMTNYNNDVLGQIVLYDSPGLTEDQDVIKEFKKLVDDKLQYMFLRKENFPILLYFLKKDDGISDKVYDFIKYLNNKNFIIFFVITFSKKGGDTEYRDNLIHQLKVRKTLTDKNLELLTNNGQNVINVNLKEDEDIGEFYGFNDVYKEILKLFPANFDDNIREILTLNKISRLLGFIQYKEYFFLKNCQNKEDFLARVSSKIDDKINISAAMASFAGLIPIPFADIPFIYALEFGLIRYMCKVYEINENDVNTRKLLAFGPRDNMSEILLNLISNVLKATNILDLVPVVGMLVSFFTNSATIKTYGKALKKHFENMITDEKTILIIKNIMKDYHGIYLNLKDDLCERTIFNIDN